MKLEGIKEITGKIRLKSGLHIGAGDTEMRIGGTDNPVVTHPYTLEPYIPGSSLKGKVRSLLELRSGLMGMTEGAPLSLKTLKTLKERNEFPEETQEVCKKILMIFGASGADSEESEGLGPARASFADSPLDDDWKKEAMEKRIPFTEVKAENSINRIKGTAENPRFTERVPSETQFRFSISLRQMKEDDEDLEELLLEGLKLLQMDSLGGNGSRGYGKVEFIFDDPATNEKFSKIEPL